MGNVNIGVGNSAGAWVKALMMGGQLDAANRRLREDLKRVVESKITGNGK